MYVVLWITLSGTVILYNKWILAYYGFPCKQSPCSSNPINMSDHVILPISPLEGETLQSDLMFRCLLQIPSH